MILLVVLVVFIIILVITTTNENFNDDVYRQVLISSANSNICQSGKTLVNCKQTTPMITSTLDSISTVCQCG